MGRAKKTAEFLFLLLLTGALIGSAFYLATYIEENDAARTLVSEYGILGMVAIGIVSGLNVFIPMHAASFAPAFTAAGFSYPSIIAALVCGTLIADLLAYQVARWGKRSTQAHFPRADAWLTHIKQEHHRLILPGVFFFAACIPIPNEVLLIPLGLMGYRVWALIPPLLLGTFVNQILYTYVFVSFFNAFF